jgi:hypothetical protein
LHPLCPCGKDRLLRGALDQCVEAMRDSCRSSVVEHSLGKGQPGVQKPNKIGHFQPLF